MYSMETKGELQGQVRVELQHCVSVKEDGQQVGMMFAVSKVEDGGTYSNFVLREGQFGIGSHGKLEMEFPNWRAAIVRQKAAAGPSPVFLAYVYYQQLSPTKCLIHFIIVPNQEAWKEVYSHKDETELIIVVISYFSTAAAGPF